MVRPIWNIAPQRQRHDQGLCEPHGDDGRQQEKQRQQGKS